MGLDVEQKDNDGAGFTPLHWATQENKKEVVRELLKNGADPNVQDCEGFSPCIYSSQ